jgi:hypothetical protein
MEKNNALIEILASLGNPVSSDRLMKKKKRLFQQKN